MLQEYGHLIKDIFVSALKISRISFQFCAKTVTIIGRLNIVALQLLGRPARRILQCQTTSISVMEATLRYLNRVLGKPIGLDCDLPYGSPLQSA